nr:immunoglobulin heavy chain junction region [Mus musculus]
CTRVSFYYAMDYW